jgi:Holliday junction resolvase RusA-like endonuclease
LAEWLGSGLQSRLQQFESARRLSLPTGRCEFVADDFDYSFEIGPPPEEQIVLDVGPVSHQGNANARARLREEVRLQTEKAGRLFIGEVGVDVEWMIHESRRWGTPGVLNTPDIDNILKPLIDGLCGPTGLLIDDCQVQSLSCGWIDWTDRNRQRLIVTVRTLMADEWLSKGRVIGVEGPDGIVWPIKDDEPPAFLHMLVSFLVENRAMYKEALGRGICEEHARLLLSIAPVFRRIHFERHGFDVISVDDYLAQLARRPR